MLNFSNQVLLILASVALAYLAFVTWLLAQARTWTDPAQVSEPASLHYLSGAWRRHYLSLFDKPSPWSALHGLLGPIHYLVMVPLTCIYWLSVPVLNGIDAAAMAVRGLRIKCGNAGCYHSVDLPVHVCPRCDERHRDLRPGRHGLFQRKCRCDSPLPTMLVCGRHSLKSLCPHCDQPLGWSFTKDLHVILVAGPAAGKTSLLTGLFHALRKLQREGMIKLQFTSPEHERSFDTSLRSYQQGYVPDKTKATLPASFIIQVINRARETINVHVYDVAGEVYQDRESLLSHAYFAHADAVLFLVDPFSLHEVQQQVGEKLDPYRDQVTACDEAPQHVYDRLLTVLRSFKETSSRLGDLPVAVTLTKVDALSLNLGLPSPRLADEDSSDFAEVRRWLEERGEGNLVRSLEHDFSHVGFFACSALGHLPEEGGNTPFEPVGVLSPMEWLLARSGFRLKTEEREEATTRSARARASTAPRSELIAGSNAYAWAALAASLACWLLPGMTCKVSGAGVAGLLSVLGFMRSTRVLGQGAWVAGLSLVLALIGTGLLSAEEGIARHHEQQVANTLATAAQKAQEEDFFTARTLLTGIVVADPSNVTARVELARVESRLVIQLLQRGEAELRAGNFDMADRSFRSASRLRAGESAESGMRRTLESRILALRDRSRQALASGDLASAENLLREALFFDAGNSATTADLATVLEAQVAAALAEGETLQRDHKFEEARARYQEGLKTIDGHPAAKQHLADLETAITKALLADAEALLAKEDFKAAEATFLKAQQREGGHEAGTDGLARVKKGRIRSNLARGHAAQKRREYDSAIGRYETVLILDSTNKQARKGVASCKQAKHDDEIKAGHSALARDSFDAAKQHFEKARTILPKSTSATKGLALTRSKQLYHEGYVDGKKVGHEIALQSQRPTARENLEGSIRATEWRVQQQKEGIKDEPSSYREGWRTGVNNAIRAEFIAMLPPEPKPEPPQNPDRVSVIRHGDMKYYVILGEGDEAKADRLRTRACIAGLPAGVYDSRTLSLDGPPASIAAVVGLDGPEEMRTMLRRARAAGFADAYSASGCD